MTSDASDRPSELRLRAAIESAPSGLIMSDVDGRIVLVNREVERLFGYSREELLGRPVERLVPERFRGKHPGFRHDFLRAPRMRAMGAGRDLFGLRKDGSEVPVEIGLTPVVTDEGIHVLTAVVDISARKRAEEDRQRLEEHLRQSQKMEAIGTLAGGIAHDFNNFLAAIVGYCELAIVADSLEESRDLLSNVLAAADRGRQLVERILTFTRQQPINKRPIELGRTITDAVKLLRPSLPPSIALETHADDKTPRVLADATSVQQVLMNLATNAAHAMSSKGGTLTLKVDPVYLRDSAVRSHPGLREGSYAVITVEDDGEGMEPAVLARAFEPFYTTKAPGAGTGLGLTMVHNIMRGHDGAVYIDSSPGQGTMIRCFFPALADDEQHLQVRSGEAVRGHGEHILLVDDEVMLATLGQKRLTAAGYRVTAVSRSTAALGLLLDPQFDYALLVTDYWMPELNGLELARKAHAARPELPILMMTGFGEELPASELAAAGIELLVHKPLTLLELCEAVDALIRRATAVAAAAPSILDG